MMEGEHFNGLTLLHQGLMTATCLSKSAHRHSRNPSHGSQARRAQSASPHAHAHARASIHTQGRVLLAELEATVWLPLPPLNENEIQLERSSTELRAAAAAQAQPQAQANLASPQLIRRLSSGSSGSIQLQSPPLGLPVNSLASPGSGQRQMMERAMMRKAAGHRLSGNMGSPLGRASNSSPNNEHRSLLLAASGGKRASGRRRSVLASFDARASAGARTSLRENGCVSEAYDQVRVCLRA